MNKQKGVIFLGPPGSGKGTQGQELASRLGVPHISTGEILRGAIAANTPLGQQAQSYVDRGELVPDPLLLDLIRERLHQSDTEKGWILDGFPRNVAQAQFLDLLISEFANLSTYVINLEVPDEVLIERLMQRGRQDDTAETIGRRLQVYYEQTQPVISYYQQKSALTSVNGNRAVEEISNNLDGLVQS
ncbi:MAG: adenylate kinase [Chroococcopsis gigantea SAG 12.99]|jgi:adenylate kinase|nr:adenylate kinase [Chlorogloea purpurea SAG 13.99]MDV3001835.1 adenylate kinase [Chroococcopsis gigantea SAG 12.99]